MSVEDVGGKGNTADVAWTSNGKKFCSAGVNMPKSIRPLLSTGAAIAAEIHRVNGTIQDKFLRDPISIVKCDLSTTVIVCNPYPHLGDAHKGGLCDEMRVKYIMDAFVTIQQNVLSKLSPGIEYRCVLGYGPMIGSLLGQSSGNICFEYYGGALSSALELAREMSWRTTIGTASFARAWASAVDAEMFARADEPLEILAQGQIVMSPMMTWRMKFMPTVTARFVTVRASPYDDAPPARE